MPAAPDGTTPWLYGPARTPGRWTSRSSAVVVGRTAGCGRRSGAHGLPRRACCWQAEAAARRRLSTTAPTREGGTFVRIDAVVVRACHFHEKLGPRLDASSFRRRWPSVSSPRDRPRLPQGPKAALGPRAALGGAAGLARNEGLRRVHLRRIRDADLFEDRSQVLAERVARVLGLPDVDDPEPARAFAGYVGKDAPDRPVRH
jgi:hypothetical protein